jgi:hypothetical protein
MSKIEVNAIEPQSGTTLTLGASGDTVALAAGALQSGFGRSGSVNWDTTPKTTSPVTAVSGNGYFINTTSIAITVNLPSTPAAGDIVAIADYANTSATNNIIVGRNGSNIDGLAVDGTIKVNGQVYTLVYVDATEGWKTVNQTFNQITTAEFIIATGGTITTSGDYKIHSFTGPGNFVVSKVGNSGGSNSVDYLVVAGGGGGATNAAGGGGAGGFRTSTLFSVSVTDYPITIGAGGAGGPGPASSGSQGNSSIFSTITSAGGGFGGGSIPGSTPGNPGGSGGGGQSGTSTGGTGNTPPVSPPQGNDGGGSTGVAPSYGAGGGGGAGGVGTAGTPTVAGVGGPGSPVTSIFGVAPQSFYGPTNGIYAGGGGGGINSGNPGGAGGPGGGGAGSQGAGVAGTTNTGGGGGGASNGAAGGAGGSGIILIRYKFQ